MQNDRFVMCPLVDEKIEDIDCIENRDVVDDMLIEDGMPSRFKQKENWRDICKKCKWHNY